MVKSPFLHLFELKENTFIPGGVLHDLLDKFNHSKLCFAFGNSNLKFTERDADLELGLNLKGKTPRPTGKQTEFTELLCGGKSIKEAKIKKYLVDNFSSAEPLLIVKALYMLLFAMVLFSKCLHDLDAMYVQIVDDWEKIGNYNWASEVYKMVNQEIFGSSKWVKGQKYENGSYFKGCTWALLAISSH